MVDEFVKAAELALSYAEDVAFEMDPKMFVPLQRLQRHREVTDLWNENQMDVGRDVSAKRHDYEYEEIRDVTRLVFQVKVIAQMAAKNIRSYECNQKHIPSRR